MDTGTTPPARGMIIDASIWIDHINKGEPRLDALLISQTALMHPHVLGEVALGSIRRREAVLDRLASLPTPNVAKEGHVLDMIDRYRLWGSGIGYTDAHLLASALITPDNLLWTRDKRLHRLAERLSVAADLD